VLSLTALGHSVLDGGGVDVEVEVEVTGSAARDRSHACAPGPDLLDASAGERFERLRAWRRAASLDAAVPAYVVFGDRTLRELAHRNPSTAGALAGVPGVGPAKLARYGEEVLRVLAAEPS
jgi:ATP-dependent DNA helicase RecQ